MKTKVFKNIFLSSIHQNAGKTTISLGLFRALKERRLKTTFMKPVGQQYVHVGDMDVDKDSYLMGEVFRTKQQLKDMSPVTIGRGYTEQYILNPHKDKLQGLIEQAFQRLTAGKDAIIVEGTGHAGVGSVIDFSNADVARLLGSKAIIVSEGGIGKSIDEIILNKALFDLKQVEIAGVIVNKVLLDKYAKIKKILGKGLANKGIPLLGVIPVQPMLSAPTLDQIYERLDLKLLCGEEALARRVNNTIVAAMEPHNMIHSLRDGTLVLTSGDRVDNILAAITSHLADEGKGKKFGVRIAGIILTGSLIPSPKIVELLKRSHMPVLVTENDTYTVAAKIENLICKIQKTDQDKIEEAARLVKKYVDVDAILNSFNKK
jgi:BioD-like phosphotransacetylase family protein